MAPTGTTKRQAPGIEPSNPYQTLCLHPAAPRELIDEAYWMLVERARTAKASSASERLLSALNGAYAALSDSDRRQEVDGTLKSEQLRAPSLRLRRTGWPLGGRKVAADHTNLYHLLRVDPRADMEIVALAYRVLSAHQSGPRAETALLRRLLLDAYEVLGNPALRATYDQSIGIGMTSSDERGKPADGARPLIEEQVPPSTDSTELDMSVRECSPAGEREPIETAIEPPARLLVDQEPAPAKAAVPTEVAEPGGAVAEPASAPDAPRRRRGLNLIAAARGVVATTGIARSDAQVRISKQDLTADAEQRLLTLQNGHGEGGESPPHRWHPDYGATVASAELVFIDGPRTGARVSLGHEAVTIGSAHEADVMLSDDGGDIAPQHARIWQHGDRFVLRQIADNGTLVGGQSLALPLVMLDDGDEIEIGAHRMRFSLMG